MEETAGKIKKNNLCWYVVYTMSKAERKVKERLDKAGIENYLPLQSVVRLWNGHKKQVTVPVIPGCIFVRIPVQDILTVSTTLGVAFLLKEEGKPVVVPDSQMELFNYMLGYSGEVVEFTLEDFQPGEFVRITSGQMTGLTGEIVKYKGRNKLIVRIEGLGCALIKMSAVDVKKCK